MVDNGNIQNTIWIWYKRKARPAKPPFLCGFARFLKVRSRSPAVIVYGCKLRVYLSLQPLLYYSKSGTDVRIVVFMSVYNEDKDI